MAGLTASARRAILDQTLLRLHHSIRAQCASASPNAPKLNGVPDIAVHGDP